AVSTKARSNSIGEENSEAPNSVALADPAFTDGHSSAHASAHLAVTVGASRDDGRLLTIRDVAQLLRVPVSWVYEHTRRRSVDRMPGFRLGKYWRFNEADVRSWLREKTQE